MSPFYYYYSYFIIVFFSSSYALFMLMKTLLLERGRVELMRNVHGRLRVGCRRRLVAAAVALRAVRLRGDVVVVTELVLRGLIGQRLLRWKRHSLRRSPDHGRSTLGPGDADDAAAARPALPAAYSPVRVRPHVNAPEDGC